MTKKTPLVLVPGTLCDAALWRHQTANLADIADVTVADHARHDTMSAIARSILQEAPVEFARAGLSMGGFVCFEIMRQAPDRVLRLALLDTSARPDMPEQAARRRDLIALVERGNFTGVTPRLLSQYIHPDRLDDTDLADEIQAMAERVGSAAYLRQQNANATRADARPMLGRIACPTLVVCGRQDAAVPLDHSEEIADGIPGARLVVIEDAVTCRPWSGHRRRRR